MWFRRTTDQLLNEPRRISTADYLCKLMEEQNSLLREVVRAVSGQHPKTIKARPTTANRIRTDKDVIQVNRDMMLKQQEAEAELKAAIWRNGPATGQMGSTSGNMQNDRASDPEALNPKPSAP